MKVGNLSTIPWYVRLLVLVVVGFVFYGGFWYFVTKGTRAETKEINDKVAQLLQQNAQAQIAEQRLNEFKATYKSRQEDLDELKSLLPDQRELTSVLQSVQDRARTSHLSFRRFSPKDEIPQEFYNGKPIEIEVSSTFSNLRDFYNQIAHYQRIVSITDFKLTQLSDEVQQPGRTVNAQFLLTAYYVTPEKLKIPAAGAQKPANGAAPASPAATAAAVTAPVK